MTFETLKIKNKDLVESAKFFLFDPKANWIEYSEESNELMIRNISVFRELYSTLYNLEMEISELKKSEKYKSFIDALLDLSKDFLDLGYEYDESTIHKTGGIPILQGCESEVMSIKESLTKDPEYSDFFDSLNSKESDFITTLNALNTSDVYKIPYDSTNVKDLKFTQAQWYVLSLIITKGN